MCMLLFLCHKTIRPAQQQPRRHDSNSRRDRNHHRRLLLKLSYETYAHNIGANHTNKPGQLGET
jgi:hypothetical protein